MCGSERSSTGGGVVCAAWRACAPSAAAPQPQAYRKRSGWGQALQPEEDARAWEELLPHLPEGVHQLWAALGDVRQLRRVLAEYGGRTLRIPAAVPPQGHALRRRLGALCLRRLVAACGGTEIYVPTCRAMLAKLRRQEIIREFSRATARGQSSVNAVAALAARHALSDRRIWQILKTSDSAPRGAALLRDLPGKATAGSHDTPLK